MRARQLATPFPTVWANTPAVEAARLLATHNLPGLIVVDETGKPEVILPGTQVLRMAIPAYCQEDPTLARVVEESAADVFLRGLGDRTVAECLAEQSKELPVVGGDATVLEIASLMAQLRSPVVAVVEDAGALVGAITLDALLETMLAT